MGCKCIPCADCGGTGNVWYAFDGEYLGNHRCDDMDELETCDMCDGSGIGDYCDECQWSEDED